MKIQSSPIAIRCSACEHQWDLSVPDYIDHAAAGPLAKSLSAVRCTNCGAGSASQKFVKPETITILTFEE